MLALTLTSLFVIVTFATLVSLTDSWLRWRYAFETLKRERALANAGFVPMVEAQELRLRDPQRTSLAATRSFARRLPQCRHQRSREPAFFAA